LKAIDRMLKTCNRVGVHFMLDLRAHPGSQN
jgi:hypothetical protein